MRTRNFQDKIINLQDLAAILSRHTYRGSIGLVLTTGAFDMLHLGHVRYLWRAAEKGDYLVVGVDSDNRVKSAKGEHRPFFQEDDRAIVVAGLGFVDLVCVFDDMKELLDAVLPSILVVSPTSTEDVSFNRKIYAKSRGIAVVEIAEQAKMHTSDFAKQIRQKILKPG
jgi:rfaE bifunctional protein nucleotidyltransferase chain/domain